MALLSTATYLLKKMTFTTESELKYVGQQELESSKYFVQSLDLFDCSNSFPFFKLSGGSIAADLRNAYPKGYRDGVTDSTVLAKLHKNYNYMTYF